MTGRQYTRSAPYVPNDYRIEGDTAHIILTDKRGNRTGEAVIDLVDLDRVLAAGRWYLHRIRHYDAAFSYAACYVRKGSPTYTKRNQRLYLHRFVLDAPEGTQVDHEQGDGLDCRKANLRIVSQRQNSVNSYHHRRIARLEAEVAELRAILVEERATAILLRDELEDYRPRAWPTRRERSFLQHTARRELEVEGLLPAAEI